MINAITKPIKAILPDWPEWYVVVVAATSKDAQMTILRCYQCL